MVSPHNRGLGTEILIYLIEQDCEVLLKCSMDHDLQSGIRVSISKQGDIVLGLALIIN